MWTVIKGNSKASIATVTKPKCREGPNYFP